jgi:hypothetical protein
MTFQQAQQRYQQLQEQYHSGQLSPEQFQAEVNRIRVRDSRGRTWSLGVESGKWYVYQGGAWISGSPPLDSAGDSSPAPQKKRSCLGRGCLILVILAVLAAGCLGSVWALNRFLDLDLLDRVLGWEEWTDLDVPRIVEDDFSYNYPTPGPLAPTRPAPAARTVDLTPYSGGMISAAFSYPADWTVEMGDGQVGFLDPDSLTTLYVGEYPVEPGSTAAGISAEVRASLESESRPGTFREIESTPWDVPGGEDAHLNAWEWTDSEGYFQWAFDLEIVAADISYYFFLIGDDPEQAYQAAELIERIGETFQR